MYLIKDQGWHDMSTHINTPHRPGKTMVGRISLTSLGSPTSQLAQLRRLWREWLEMVKLFANRSRSRKQIQPEMYKAVHHHLLAQCRAMADQDGKLHNYYHYLTNLVSPWLSCDIFLQTDQEILVDLLFRCKEIEDDLRERRFFEIAMKLIKPVLIVLLIGFTAGMVFLTRDTIWLPLEEWVRENYFVVVRYANRMGTMEKWILVGALVFLIGMGIASYSRRS